QPSTVRAAPLTKLPSSEARNSAALVTSSARPMRARGMIETKFSLNLPAPSLVLAWLSTRRPLTTLKDEIEALNRFAGFQADHRFLLGQDVEMGCRQALKIGRRMGKAPRWQDGVVTGGCGFAAGGEDSVRPQRACDPGHELLELAEIDQEIRGEDKI